MRLEAHLIGATFNKQKRKLVDWRKERSVKKRRQKKELIVTRDMFDFTPVLSDGKLLAVR